MRFYPLRQTIRNMKWFVQVLSTKTADSQPAIIVNFDSKRYLFECGEGTQRFATQHKIRLTGISDIFISRLSWDNFGGLPGLLLTMSDAVSSHKMNIHGPRNLTHLLNTLRHFVPPRDNLELKTFEYERGTELKSVFQDENLRVETVALDRCLSQQQHVIIDAVLEQQQEILGSIFYLDPLKLLSERQKTKIAKCDVSCENASGKRIVVRSRDPLSKSLSVPMVFHSDQVLCFIGTGPEVARKFDKDAAKRLGIPSGPDRSLLVKGHSITLPDGRVIHPDECTTPPRPGLSFIILNIPSRDYLPSLFASESRFSNVTNVKLVLHCACNEVLNDTEYINWIKSTFKNGEQHIVVNTESMDEQIVYHSSFEQLRTLNDISSEFFPLPRYSDPENVSRNSLLSQFLSSGTASCITADILMKFNMEPLPSNLDLSSLPERIMKHQLAENASDFIKKEVCITFLGTGSMLPSKYRNVSGILVEHEEGSMFMDAGESTFGQLLRYKGKSHVKSIMNNLKAIFISHLHADHHLGTIKVIMEWSKYCLSGKLFIFAPTRMRNFLEEVAEAIELPLDRLSFVDNADLVSTDSGWCFPNTQVQINTQPVDHCPNSYAVSVVYGKHGKQVIYSGDTRPCEAIPRLSRKDCYKTIIHECTYSDDFMEEAKLRRHSTFSEAIQVAIEANAQELLLTHFSQRYPYIDNSFDFQSSKLQKREDQKKKLSIGVAVDGMSVTSGRVDQLMQLLPAMVQLLQKESADESKEKTQEISK